MKLDKYKQAVVDEYISTDHNIFINASAGTGKTTLLLHLLAVTPSHKKCLFLAFNKSIAEELQRRCLGKDNVEIKTIHSKAFSTLLSHSRGLRYNLNKWRDYAVAARNIDFPHGLDEKKRNGQIWNISRIYNLMRINLLDISCKNEIKSVCTRWNVDFNDYYYEMLKVFVNGLEQDYSRDKKKGVVQIDFTDQLYYCYNNIPLSAFPKYDVIFVDEAQDLNPLQRELILQFLAKNGRLITCGDYHQCIYFFQGSSIDSFSMLQNRPNTVSLPLNMTYRCAKEIVKVAKKYSPEIEAQPEAEDGLVREGTLSEVMGGDYVICRNNLPLVEAFIELVKQKKRAVIIGKDYGDGLLYLLSQVHSIRDLRRVLEEKANELKERGVRNVQTNETYVALKEKVTILELLISYSHSFPAASELIEELFKEKDDMKDSDVVRLSTIHKSKGLEAERVFILGFNELIPSEWATTKDELYAEQCLQFVAVTRAKKELIFIKYNKK